uniref:MT domain-containing protein n=1 Tax=Macrostomum lignano TaxID=282301 RepID=A0A1I8GMU8_9PLAT
LLKPMTINQKKLLNPMMLKRKLLQPRRLNQKLLKPMRLNQKLLKPMTLNQKKLLKPMTLNQKKLLKPMRLKRKKLHKLMRLNRQLSQLTRHKPLKIKGSQQSSHRSSQLLLLILRSRKRFRPSDRLGLLVGRGQPTAKQQGAGGSKTSPRREQLKLRFAELDSALLAKLRNADRIGDAISETEAAAERIMLKEREVKKLKEAKLTLHALEQRKNNQRLMLRSELEEADELIERERKLNSVDMQKKQQQQSMMTARSLLELRAYQRPVESVHKTVRALLLLAGNYEKRTRKWKRCQPLLKGVERLANGGFDATSVDPRIAARSQQILSGIDRREMALQSPAAFAVFDWTVEAVKSIKEANDGENFKPASIGLQRRILHVSKEEDAMLDFEDFGIKRRV